MLKMKLKTEKKPTLDYKLFSNKSKKLMELMPELNNSFNKPLMLLTLPKKIRPC